MLSQSCTIRRFAETHGTARRNVLACRKRPLHDDVWAFSGVRHLVQRVMRTCQRPRAKGQHPVSDHEQPVLLKISQVCEATNLGRSTIYLAITRGELPVRKFGRSVRIERAALQAWIEGK